jgi:hypothetical protein
MNEQERPTAKRPACRRRTATVCIAVAATLGLAACGGSGPSSTNASSQSPDDGAGAAYRFAACMRSHGLSNFPDPVVNSSAGKLAVGIRVTPALTSSPQFQTAQKACQGILPPPQKNDGRTPAQQHAREQHILAFARCLRGHGVTNFPDPNPQGELTLPMVAAASVDIHSPAFKTAAETCLPAAGGLLTQAALQAAESGATH